MLTGDYPLFPIFLPIFSGRLYPHDSGQARTNNPIMSLSERAGLSGLEQRSQRANEDQSPASDPRAFKAPVADQLIELCPRTAPIPAIQLPALLAKYTDYLSYLKSLSLCTVTS